MEQYLVAEAGAEGAGSLQRMRHWRLALDEAFQRRLGALEGTYPAVTLASSSLSHQQRDAALPLGSPVLLLAAAEERQKRPLSAEGVTPKQKMQRLLSGKESAKRVYNRKNERRASEGQRAALSAATLFADLQLAVQSSQPEGFSEALQSEGAEHVLWLKHLLGSNNHDSREGQDPEAKGLSLEAEQAENSRLTTSLAVLRGGF